MCDGLGRQFSYACPNTTLFQQRMLICDHWYMVNCSKAESDYGANLLIGKWISINISFIICGPKKLFYRICLLDCFFAISWSKFKNPLQASVMTIAKCKLLLNIKLDGTLNFVLFFFFLNWTIFQIDEHRLLNH